MDAATLAQGLASALSWFGRGWRCSLHPACWWVAVTPDTEKNKVFVWDYASFSKIIHALIKIQPKDSGT